MESGSRFVMGGIHRVPYSGEMETNIEWKQNAAGEWSHPWTLNVTHPAPCMTQDHVQFTGTRDEAATLALAIHLATGRSVSLAEAPRGVYCWALWQRGRLTFNRLNRPLPELAELLPWSACGVGSLIP